MIDATDNQAGQRAGKKPGKKPCGGCGKAPAHDRRPAAGLREMLLSRHAATAEFADAALAGEMLALARLGACWRASAAGWPCPNLLKGRGVNMLHCRVPEHPVMDLRNTLSRPESACPLTIW